MVNPSDCEVCFFFNAQGDVMAARVVGIRQEEVNPCRVVPSMRDETVQLHDVTDKVQRAQLRIAVQKREVRVAALELRI